jgi:uncharacterized repeat protein (TIGR03809 family)
MAHREFECPVPRISALPQTMVQATVRLEAVALKWRGLAERRRDHHIDLYKSGRWRHYYTDQEFLIEMRTAIALAERWARIAPRPEEREAADNAARQQAKIAELLKVVEFLEARAA